MLRVKELRLGSEGKEVSSSALAASTNSSCTSPSCQSTSSSASNRGGGGKGKGGRGGNDNGNNSGGGATSSSMAPLRASPAVVRLLSRPALGFCYNPWAVQWTSQPQRAQQHDTQPPHSNEKP